MHTIYEVRYEIQWHSFKPAQWEPQSVHVLTAGDAQDAVDRARAEALKQHQVNDNGVDEHCTAFRLRGVTLVAEATL